jgi:uncharacterized protein YuzE
MRDLNRMVIRNVPIPTLEIDPTCHAVYMRFKKGKVHKTLHDDRRGAVVTVDVDANNEIIGVEMVGVTRFSIKAIRKLLPDRLKDVDLESASFVPASSCRADPVPA